MFTMLEIALTIFAAAASAKGNAVPPAAPKVAVATRPARISIDIDGEVATLTIPVGSPALLEHDGWTKSFAIVATDRIDDGPSTISIALIPADTTNDKTTKAEVAKMAIVTKTISSTESLVLVPGKEVPAQTFGKNVPKRFVISLAAKK